MSKNLSLQEAMELVKVNSLMENLRSFHSKYGTSELHSKIESLSEQEINLIKKHYEIVEAKWEFGAFGDALKSAAGWAGGLLKGKQPKGPEIVTPSQNPDFRPGPSTPQGPPTKLDTPPKDYIDNPPQSPAAPKVEPPKSLDPPRDSSPSKLKGPLIGGAALVGTGVAVDQVMKPSDSKQTAAADAGTPAVDPMGFSSPGTETDISGTKFKPEPKVAEPPKFQGGADKAKEMQPSSEYEVKKGDNLWNIVKSRGKDMSNQDIAKEVSRISSLNKMKNPDLILPGQKIKFEETTPLNKSLLDAFNGVINSKSGNIFAEAKKAASEPKTEKEKSLAALAEPKDKITHKDVLVGRGVVKEEEVGFSEAELAHIASIVEGMPVAPTPEDQAPTPTPKNKAEGGKGKGSLAEGRKKEEESLGDNMLHMNVKKAADNMSNVKHKFANGESVNMTKAMAVGFLNRHSAAKTADQKDAILKHANKSLDAFKHITQGGAVPKEEAPKIKLGTMKGK